MNTEELKQKALAIRIPHDWWSESVSGAVPAVFYRAGGIDWAAVATQEIPKCVAPADCDNYTFSAIERARISEFVAAANPAAILALIAEIARFTQDAEMAAASLNLLTGHHEHLLAEFDRVTKQRDELLAALREIAAWVERYTAGGHPVSVVARAAIAKAEG